MIPKQRRKSLQKVPPHHKVRIRAVGIKPPSLKSILNYPEKRKNYSRGL